VAINNSKRNTKCVISGSHSCNHDLSLLGYENDVQTGITVSLKNFSELIKSVTQVPINYYAQQQC